MNQDMFGANIGRAMENVGKGFEQLSDSFAKIQDMKDEALVDKAVTTNYEQSTQKTEDFMQKPGDQQTAGLKDHMDNLVKGRDDLSTNMTPNQKRMYDAKTSGYLRSQLGGSMHSAVTTQKQFTRNSYESSIARDTDILYTHLNDPEAFQQDLERIRDTAMKINEIDGMNGKDMLTDLQKRLSTSAHSVIESTLNKGMDPDKALEILKRFGNNIPQQTIITETNNIEARRAELLGKRSGNSTTAPPTVLPPTTESPAKPPVEKRSDVQPLIQGALLQYASLTYNDPTTGGRGGGDDGGGNPKGNMTIDARASGPTVRTDLLHPEFRSRLNTAIEAAEKATGEKGKIVDAFRDPKRQAQYYANYTGRSVQWEGKTYTPQGRGGLAAPPGKSRHQAGMAADLGNGAVLRQLRQWAQSGELRKFGLEFLPGRAGVVDPGHIQLATSLYTRA